jgi:hypothetical protein
VRRPSADDLWLFVGYLTWFAMIYALWWVVFRLLPRSPLPSP